MPTGYVPRMVEVKTVNIVLLNGSNYGTWTLKCRMTLVRDGLLGIVPGMELQVITELFNDLTVVGDTIKKKIP